MNEAQGRLLAGARADLGTSPLFCSFTVRVTGSRSRHTGKPPAPAHDAGCCMEPKKCTSQSMKALSRLTSYLHSPEAGPEMRILGANCLFERDFRKRQLESGYLRQRKKQPTKGEFPSQ